MISQLLNSFIIGVLFVDMLERRFPENFRDVLTEVTLNTLYFYSKLQIYFARANKNFNVFIEANPFLLKIKTELYSIIKPKVVILTQFIKNGEYLNIENSCNCDFTLFSWLGDDKNCTNKKIIYYLNGQILDEQQAPTEFSDIKFMLIELIIGENKYKVDLKTDDYNFYLVGNKFTKQFFLYYLKQILHINNLINEDDKFILKIIDHDVNTIDVEFSDKNDSILLEKNGYKVLITNHHDK